MLTATHKYHEHTPYMNRSDAEHAMRTMQERNPSEGWHMVDNVNGSICIKGTDHRGRDVFVTCKPG